MKLAKASIPYRALRDIGTITAALVFSGNVSLKAMNLAFLFVAAIGFGVIVSVSLIWEYIVWRRYDFFFEDDSLKITHGVFRRKEREIPYRRIQNVNLNKNIIHRVLGIVKVDFETAGGSGTEASLKYVSESEAKGIKKKVREFKNEEEAENGEGEREKLFGFSENDLLAYSFLTINRKSIGTVLGGFGILASLSAGFFDGAGAAPVVILTLGGLLVAGISWAVNAVMNYIQYYDFKLWREKDTLEYERGLLNRSEGSIPVEKIQGLTIEENFLKRQFDYATLEVETAGMGGNDGQKSSLAEVAIPLAGREKVMEFARSLEKFQELNTSDIPSRARRRYFGRYAIGIIILMLTGAGLNNFINFNYLMFAGLVPVAAVAAHLKWVNKAFEVQDEYFVAVNGFWSRRTSLTPYYRIQNLIQTETVFQRRWDLSTLTLDTAGSSIFEDSRAVDLDGQESEEIREEVFERFKKSLKDEELARF